VVKTPRAAMKRWDKMKSEAMAANNPLFDGEEPAEPRIFDALADPEVIAKVPADAREDFTQLAGTWLELSRMLEGDDPAKPEELIQRGLEGWYGDYIKTVYTDYESRQEDLQGLISFASRYDTLNELLAQLVLMSSETTSKSVEVQEDAVRMTTIHQAKGLEYPVVFVIGCADELFPLRRAIENGDVEEERRLFYVAVTRAKEELYLCFPMVSSGRGQAQRLMPSRFLQEIPRERYEKLQVRQAW